MSRRPIGHKEEVLTSPSLTATLAARYQVHLRVAQLAVSRGVYERCAELADRDENPSRGFLAAANVLAKPPLPKFRPLAELLECPERVPQRRAIR